MNYLLKRKLQEKLKLARPLVVAFMKSVRAFQSSLSGRLRKIEALRKILNLPSNQSFTWLEWVSKDDDFEVSLDPDKKNLVVPLPRTNQEEVHWAYRNCRNVNIQRTFVASIKDGYAWGYNAGCFFTRNGDHLWDLGKEHWLNYDNFYSSTRLYFSKPLKISGTVAVLAHPDAYSNYGHWLFDVAPKLGILERAGFSPGKVDHYAVGYRGLKFQLETFERAGIPISKLIPFEQTTFIQAHQLLVPFLTTYWDQNHQQSTIDYIRQLSGIKEFASNGHRLLFISRRDASFRRLLQEYEIQPALEAMGFEFVTLAGTGLVDTAKLFGSARVVVGPTGSGLMNIVFCPRDAKLLEIVGPSYFTCHHWYLAEECGVEHHYFMGEGNPVMEAGLMVDLTKDITVNVDELISYVKKLVDS